MALAAERYHYPFLHLCPPRGMISAFSLVLPSSLLIVVLCCNSWLVSNTARVAWKRSHIVCTFQMVRIVQSYVSRIYTLIRGISWARSFSKSSVRYDFLCQMLTASHTISNIVLTLWYSNDIVSRNLTTANWIFLINAYSVHAENVQRVWFRPTVMKVGFNVGHDRANAWQETSRLIFRCKTADYATRWTTQRARVKLGDGRPFSMPLQFHVCDMLAASLCRLV